ncbi:protein spaetzle 4-like isoform X2 [Amphibalanus amphitrite]|uniref:protein spaetzle 4-like isoform X2 n=1 Tax=Amphibalanus amphitrite TaxID=1232801 RepID=UPI001C916190|nr:protein spaetzle 4-like isoform X2 [Amphibalanus amphitrite]
MDLRMITLAVLGLTLGYQASGQEAIRGLPCIQRLHQLFCRNQGNTYPNERIESFIDLNKALTIRMFGEFQAPEVSFPTIQAFRTVDFPDYLRPQDASENPVTSSTVSPVTSAPRRTSARRDARERFEAARARLRAARAKAMAARARESAARASAERRAMTRVQPTPVVTRTPTLGAATRPPFAGNVFLNGGEELIAAASQPATRYPLRDLEATNRQSAVRAGSSRRRISSARRACGRGGDCAVAVPSSDNRTRYKYTEPENPLRLPERRRSGGRPSSAGAPNTPQVAPSSAPSAAPLATPPISKKLPARIKRSSSVFNNTMEEKVEEQEEGPPTGHRRRRQSSRRFSAASRQAIPAPPKIDKGSKHLVDSCESRIEITTPFWAANSAGEIRAIVNTKHFPQAIHQEICKGTKTSRCSGDCTCEQKYTYHRLLAYDPENDCKGIFIDWFLFPSCCACRCPP